MLTGSVTELIWHFAGYWHQVQDYATARTDYGEAYYDRTSSDYRVSLDHAYGASPDLDSLGSQSVRGGYFSASDQTGHHVPWAHLHHNYTIIGAKSYAPPHHREQGPHASSDDVGLAPAHVQIRYITVVHQTAPQPLEQPEEPHAHRAPTYTIDYHDANADQFAKLTQTNVLADRDYVSDGGADYAVLHHLDSGDTMSTLMAMGKEENPSPLLPSNDSADYWTTTIAAHDDALKNGDAQPATLATGTYVDGELQPPSDGTAAAQQDPGASQPTDSSQTSPPTDPSQTAQASEPPQPPVHEEGSTDPGQVAETGGNKAVNAAVINDLDEAPKSLIVHGDYYATNAILQANVLQDRDHVFDAGGTPASVDGGGNHVGNSATFDADELVKNGGHSSYGGDLAVNVDFIDGDVYDVKSITQHNVMDDGDVTVQTRMDSYSQVHSGGNEQYNVTTFSDWGKNYDVIIVLGDYHSANVISQLNIILDDDVVGVSSGEGGSPSVQTGQNALQNQATIHNYGATTFDTLGQDLSKLIDGLKNHDTLDHDAWSGFHGAASGNLDVLLITGNYYDLNLITQVNVISDSDLAVQVASDGSSVQWLSSGGNAAENSAEIVNAGGIYSQVLGGHSYEDSILLQANLVSDSTSTTPTDPSALVTELVAFVDHQQSDMPADSASWTKDLFGNHHDTFGHVLT